MRDFSNRRSGYDRVLTAVAATFLMVSGTVAQAQDSATPAATEKAAEHAIEAAVPMPEPANVPPPTAADLKPEDVKDAAKAAEEPAKTTTAETPAAPEKAEPATTATVSPPAAPVATPASPAAPTTATGTPATDTKSTIAAVSADQPVADGIRDLLSAKATRYFDRKNERAAVDAFYKSRDYAPVWTQNGQPTARAKAAIARLNAADNDGLDPTDYPTPDFAAATTPSAMAEADLRLTASILDYARQAQSGRMHWSQVSADILYPEHPTDPAEVLTHVTTAGDATAALDSYNPPHQGYRALKAKLAELRGKSETPVAPIAEGPALKYIPARKKQAEVVVEDARVPTLRKRLGVTENADDARYDNTVAAAVRKFQANSDLKATGILDDATVKAINAPRRDRQIDIVLVNMERWRWLPRELGAAALGNAYVILNIPDFTLQVQQNGHQVWKTRVVVGKPGRHATPMLTETMKYITVNPTWNVPPSIIYGEYLPALQQDPTVLDRMGLKLERRRDGSIHISQPPGEANALGRIRFNFPNKFLVYQHDTPDKNLFAHEARAYSHGCMRVQNPDQYAATLLNIVRPDEKYTPERIRGMYGRNETNLQFATPIPVNITYQTAFVDEAGKLEFRKDIYGRDAVMISLLRSNKNLEAVVAHAQPNYSRPKADIPQGVAFNDGFGGRSSSGSGEPNFFERLFGIAPPPPPPPQTRRRGAQR